MLSLRVALSRMATTNVDLDLAHSLNCRWHSLTDLQTLVLARENCKLCALNRTLY